VSESMAGPDQSWGLMNTGGKGGELLILSEVSHQGTIGKKSGFNFVLLTAEAADSGPPAPSPSVCPFPTPFGQAGAVSAI
jgi:hypothetical protein